MAELGIQSALILKNSLITYRVFHGPDDIQEVTKMRKMKCCPKCGSTNTNFLVFYRPSIWKCQDCGYEGAFIIEDYALEKMQEHYQKKRSITDGAETQLSIDVWDDSTEDLQETSEDHLKSVFHPSLRKQTQLN